MNKIKTDCYKILYVVVEFELILKETSKCDDNYIIY